MKGLQLVFIEIWCNCNQWSGLFWSSPGPVLVFFQSYRLDLKTLSGLSPAEEAEWQIECKKPSVSLYNLLLKTCTANRVKWFCAHVAHNCAQEEVEILEAEFHCAHRLFMQMAVV